MEIHYILKHAPSLSILFFFQYTLLDQVLELPRNWKLVNARNKFVLVRELSSAVRSRIRCNNITFPSLGFYLQNYRAHLESCAIKVTHANIYLFVADVRQLYAVEVPVLHADIPHKYSPCICAMPYIRDREWWSGTAYFPYMHKPPRSPPRV